MLNESINPNLGTRSDIKQQHWRPRYWDQQGKRWSGNPWKPANVQNAGG